MELLQYNENDDLFQIMKVQMSSEQEQIFMISHYLYLQHGSDSTKFVVDFDNVWKNVEFTRRDNAKRILVKHFTEHIDYKNIAPHFGGASLEAHNVKNILAYQLGEAALSKNKAVFGEQPNECEKAAPHLGGAAPPNCGAAFTHGKNLGGAGQNKETILLTVDCFKNFCMLAATPKAKVIRSYYVKMENIMHEYYKQFQSKNNELQNSLQHSQTETAIKRHEVLIESNKNKWLVYFCKIQPYDDGSFILKIGETVDIKNRIDALRCDFGTNINLLDVFVCENSIKFEKSLHNSNELLKYKYNQLEHKNKKFSTEAYHIPNQKEYEKIVKFANSEMHKYNNIEFTRLRVEEKKIDLDASKIALVASFIPFCKNYDEVMNILNKITSPINILNNTQLEIGFDMESTHSTFVSRVQSLTGASDSLQKKENIIEEDNTIFKNEANEYNYIEEIIEENKIISSINANSTGPIVQIYHKNDLKNVVHVYNSITEATRYFNYNNKSASFTAIKKAFQHKTIYLDYRWHFITDRQESNLHQLRDIGETVNTQERKQGQVAMLNIDKTKIIKVFKISKDAAKEILQHPSAMCTAIKHSSPLNNHYWLRWENVDVSLQDDFLQSNLLPTKQKNIRGIKIKQVHPITNELVKIFASYTDIQKELKISVKKLKELIENNEIYQGKYKFKLF
jgi:hypothetical protein